MITNRKEESLSDADIAFFIFLVLAMLNAIFWIVTLCGNDLHYRNVGKITSAIPYDTVNTRTAFSREPTKVIYEYHYIDDSNDEELTQTSYDIDSFLNMGTEDHIRKHNRKYFYEYRIWTNNFVYLVLAIFCIHLCFKIANN